MACFFATRTVFLSRAWEARLTPSNPPYSEKSTPLLHMSKILTGAIDAYFCRGNGLVSKRQTFLAKHTYGGSSSSRLLLLNHTLGINPLRESKLLLEIF
jgi:hypothetical protein